MKKIIAAQILSLLCFFLLSSQPASATFTPANPNPWWQIQSIDTMKFSRDTAGQKLNDKSFDKEIDKEMQDIADTGATHVAIGTPYDEMFVPFLERWVRSAREHGLKVWFRGNFSGWEGWFNQPKIDREEHKRLLQAFIINHADLFEDGDIFTGCPEAENGGPGDPRHTGDVAGHRQFLIDEHQIMQTSFAQIHKYVQFDANSMNGDVAQLIMDPATTQALGGIVVIDHYVPTTQQLADDVHKIAQKSGGKIILGEFGAPIPDLHGKMTEDQQAQWIHDALDKLSTMPEVIGLNYWTNKGGSTALWDENGDKPRKAVAVMKSFYTPLVLSGVVTDAHGQAVQGAEFTSTSRSTHTEVDGSFSLPHLASETVAHINAEGLQPINILLPPTTKSQKVTLEGTNPVVTQESGFGQVLTNIWLWIKNGLSNLLSRS